MAKRKKSSKPIKATTIQRIKMWAIVMKNGSTYCIYPSRRKAIGYKLNIETVEPVEVIRRVPCKLKAR